MKPDKTEIEWMYQPTDFFEASKHCTYSEYDLLIENGKVLVTLQSPQGSIDLDLDARIQSEVESLFLVRQFIKHEKYELRRTKIFHYIGGKKNQTIIPEPIASGAVVYPPDLITYDAAGNLIRDTRAERIEEETALLDDIAPKLAQSPLLHNLITNHSKAIDNPANELVYLYAIRDALSTHYKGEKNVRNALSAVTKHDWSRLGKLANDEPLLEGRHPGNHLIGNLRHATAAELAEARGIVKRWIIAFAETL